MTIIMCTIPQAIFQVWNAWAAKSHDHLWIGEYKKLSQPKLCNAVTIFLHFVHCPASWGVGKGQQLLWYERTPNKSPVSPHSRPRGTTNTNTYCWRVVTEHWLLVNNHDCYIEWYWMVLINYAFFSPIL